MAAVSGVSDAKNLLGDVFDKLTSLENKLTAVDRDVSTVKLVQAEKQAAFPGEVELRLPEYDGTDDPDAWLHRFELFFELQGTKEDKQVCLAALHMTGKAQIWFYGTERNRAAAGGGRPAWPQFAESVRRRFADPMRRQPFRELLQLRQTGSVAEYREEFLGMLDRCDGVHELMQLVLFIRGLRDQLRAEVESRQPETLQDAAFMAGVLEQWHEEPGFEKN